MIIPLFDVSFQGLPDWSFSERDADVLDFLSEEQFNYFTFEGLKRRLGLHPETLSRILNRLEQEGLVRKSSEGYTVEKDAGQRVKNHYGASSKPRVVLLETYLPSDMSVDLLISNLQGRWFGLLRWLGLAKNSEGVSLKWVTEDGDVQVDARVTLQMLTIEAQFLHGYNQDLALKAAYQLMAHISKLTSRTRLPIAQHVSFFGGNHFYSMPT